MRWNDDMAQGAQKWADHIAKLGQLQHASKDKLSGQGENLYFAGHSGCGIRTCADAVHSWYEEYKNYNYKTHKQIDSKGVAVGHFTQVVWNASTELGMGIAVREEGGFTKYFIVGRYRPGGNFNMMKYGETYEQGRLRNWRANVPQRLPGTTVPSVMELRGGRKYPEHCGGSGGAGNTNPGSGNQGNGVNTCEDLNPVCPSYKQHCSRPGNNIAAVCPKTCGAC